VSGDDRVLMVGVRVAGRRALVVGGGPVATRRARRLAEAGAAVTVVAPDATHELQALADVWHAREYRSGDIEGVVLAVAATGDAEVDARVVADGEAAGVWVNHAGDWTAGTVLVPAVVSEGGVTVVATTSGRSPALARWLVEEIGRELLPVTAEAAALMGRLRAEARAAGGTAGTASAWRAALDEGLVDLLRRGDVDGAEALVRRHLRRG
jgi:siroheme synthase-like protein